MFEINLVPDIKTQMLSAQRRRNLVVFICIIVAAGAAGVSLLISSVMFGQNVIMSAKDRDIAMLNERVTDFSSLNSFLTIQNQLAAIDDIHYNRRLASRVFNVVDFLRSSVASRASVMIYSLNVNVYSDTLLIEGQIDDLNVPSNDFAALEAFKKTAELATYDYGRYMRYDRTENAWVEIPSMCIVEGMWREGYGDMRIYGAFQDQMKGCTIDGSTGLDYQTEDVDVDGYLVTNVMIDNLILRDMTGEEYEKAISNNESYFRSECISRYRGEDSSGRERWFTENSCMLLAEPMSFSQQSNGKDANSGALVLAFTAHITLDPGVLAFRNRHVIIIGPTVRNVTDSYLQVSDMFTNEAIRCGANDEACR
jgi:hypothetical protein